MRNFNLKYALSLLFIALSLGVVFGIAPPAEAMRGARKEAVNRDSQQRDTTLRDSLGRDSLRTDSLSTDSLARDTTKRKKGGLEEIMDGNNKDSLFYDALNNKVYIYNKGSVNYQSRTLNADYMEVNLDNNQIYAYGMKQTVDGKEVDSKPEFVDSGASYSMDTITYNLKSEKAKIKGVATQEGEGWLVGNHV
ncbi:MAG: LPS-assembly protein LptD, partial [Rikenellaceae bacterium]